MSSSSYSVQLSYCWSPMGGVNKSSKREDLFVMKIEILVRSVTAWSSLPLLDMVEIGLCACQLWLQGQKGLLSCLSCVQKTSTKG